MRQLALKPAAMAGRVDVPAQEVRAGDWTFCTGYRRVERVDLHPRKRTVRLHWASGAQTFRYDETLKVSKP